MICVESSPEEESHINRPRDSRRVGNDLHGFSEVWTKCSESEMMKFWDILFI